MKKHICSENIIQKISGNYKYQLIIYMLCLLMGSCTDITLYYLAFMQSKPYVEYTDSHGIQRIDQITYDICNQGNYTIVDSKSYHNWIYDYNYYCSKFKVSFLSSSLYTPLNLLTLQHSLWI